MWESLWKKYKVYRLVIYTGKYKRLLVREDLMEEQKNNWLSFGYTGEYKGHSQDNWLSLVY